MTSWKDTLQVRDLEQGQRLEVTCKTCGHVHYLTRDSINDARPSDQRYLDEIERLTVCGARGCRGKVRLAFVRNGDTSGFVGGLA